MKRYLRMLTTAVALLAASNCVAQNFIKTDLAFSFDDSKKLVQTFDFNLNRTDEVQNKNGGVYFLYTPARFYIIPTVDANIGQSVSTANNNVVTQIDFGKVLGNWKCKNGNDLRFFRLAAQISPVYNSDKTFTEKLYYGQAKLLMNWVWDGFGGTAEKSQIDREISIAVDPVLNAGIHDSKNFGVNEGYSALGLNTSLTWSFFKFNGDMQYADWAIKFSGDYYDLSSEIKALYNKNYYGQVSGEVDKSITPKIALSLAYKYGNENATYSTVNTLQLGFKYKY
jgi:hypothetical protein